MRLFVAVRQAKNLSFFDENAVRLLKDFLAVWKPLALKVGHVTNLIIEVIDKEFEQESAELEAAGVSQ
jgi:hypothetical protein